MAEGKQIRVSDDVHAKVAKIAQQNFRGLNDQVRYWAETSCEHPQEFRIALNVVVAPVLEPVKEQAAQVGKGQPFRGFFCSQCRQYVLNAEASEEIIAALKAPVVGKTSKR